MSFYQEICRYYDQIFPVQKPALHKLEALARQSLRPAAILDVACGTGAYAGLLAQLGHDVLACDLDPAMVQSAAARQGVTAFQADMTHLTESSVLRDRHGSFDLIYCIGNSLVHLPGPDAILAAIDAMICLLAPAGRLLLQIINYDRILDQAINRLPELVNETVPLRFERYYDRLEDSEFIQFRTLLTLGAPSDTTAARQFENKVPLYPLRSRPLLAMLEQAGLTGIELTGSFAGAAFDPETSQPLIVCGWKAP